jgi:hypothetical protein
VGEREGRGVLSLQLCLIKSILKITFLCKTSETTKFAEMFCKVFLVLPKKLFCFIHRGHIFVQNKKFFFNPPALRINIIVFIVVE